MKAAISIKTEVSGDRISQEFSNEINGVRKRLYTQVIELADQGVRQALIELGWTPPAAQPAPDLQAELEATNRQVEILSDALAESRREIAQLKSQRAPVQEPVGRVCFEGDEVVWTDEPPESGTLLYTTPPAAQRQCEDDK